MKVRVVNIIGCVYEWCSKINNRKDYESRWYLYRKFYKKWVKLWVVEYM